MENQRVEQPISSIEYPVSSIIVSSGEE